MSNRDLRSLLIGYVVSSVGSGVGAGALPIVAVLVLHAAAFQVSLLSGVSGLAAAAVALPFAPWIEHHRKRPIMIAADIARFVAVGSVPVAAALHVLTFEQLVVVGVISTTATIAFVSASGANLKSLTTTATRLRTNSWFETSDWISNSAGPPLGGLLIGAAGATAGMAIDAVSYLGSAVGVWRVPRAESEPPVRAADSGIVAGWRYIFACGDLRGLFFNGLLFGGPVIMTVPLLAVLILDTLGLPPVAYGLALGVPCVGGLAGSRLAPALVRRFGQRRVLLVSGMLRTPWILLYPLARHGAAGLAVIMTADTLTLVCAGIFNPVFATYRMNVTADEFMVRVRSAWNISSKSVYPLFVLAGGGLAALVGVRLALLVGGLMCVVSVALLPFRALGEGVSPVQPVGETQPAEAP